MSTKRDDCPHTQLVISEYQTGHWNWQVDTTTGTCQGTFYPGIPGQTIKIICKLCGEVQNKNRYSSSLSSLLQQVLDLMEKERYTMMNNVEGEEDATETARSDDARGDPILDTNETRMD